MVRFGILSPPGFGHLNGMIALGCELVARDHNVTILSAADAESIVIEAGLNFIAIGELEYPKGSQKAISEEMGKLSGISALLYNINLSEKVARVSLRDAPRKILNQNIQALIIDQSMIEGKTVAEVSNVPFITICNALILDSDPKIPPPLTSWDYDTSLVGMARNQLGYALLGLASLKIGKVIEDYRSQNNLSLAINSDFDSLINSDLAVISQQIMEFDFPRTKISPKFHFTGLFSAKAKDRKTIDFPWDQLNGKPLIYASLGTIQNKQFWIFDIIADACKDLDVQLVISLGGSTEPSQLKTLAGSPLIVKYAPQLELLQKAILCITHAGMNTTLESLSNGVPMVAIPITNDQPGIASRIKWTGTGEVIQVHELFFGLMNSNLKQAIRKVLYKDSYRKNALKMQRQIQSAGGVERAVDIIEQAITTGKPVYRQ